MTLGQELYSKEMTIEGIQIQINIHDLAGQERFTKFRHIYIKNSQLGFLVFDITNPNSLFELEREWMPDIQQVIMQEAEKKITDFFAILIGNKVDLRNKYPEVSHADIKLFMQKSSTKIPVIKILSYIETSALENTNVEKVFSSLVSGYLKHHISKRQ
jgi:small GTP-binding protein